MPDDEDTSQLEETPRVADKIEAPSKPKPPTNLLVQL